MNPSFDSEPQEAPTTKSFKQCNQISLDVTTFYACELERLHQEIENLNSQDLPNFHFEQRLHTIEEEVDRQLKPIGQTHADLFVFAMDKDLHSYAQSFLLNKYEDYLKNVKKIQPYTIYADLKDLQNHLASEEKKLDQGCEELINLLFNHAEIEQHLINSFPRKMHVLGIQIMRHEEERKKIELFIQDYDDNKKRNPKLENNAEIEREMRELEGIIFLQNQTRILRLGEHLATEELVSYIQYWTEQFNAMPLAEQEKKIDLLIAVDECSFAHNNSIKRATISKKIDRSKLLGCNSAALPDSSSSVQSPNEKKQNPVTKSGKEPVKTVTKKQANPNAMPPAPTTAAKQKI